MNDSHEQRVRAVWQEPTICGEDGDCCVMLRLETVVNSEPPDYTQAKAWAAAWAFTERWLEEIEQLQAEIRELSLAPSASQNRAISVARLQAILAGKQAGLKPQPAPPPIIPPPPPGTQTTDTRLVAFQIACGFPYAVALVPDSGDLPIFKFPPDGDRKGTSIGEGLDEDGTPIGMRLDPESVMEAIDWAMNILPAIRFTYLARQNEIKKGATLHAAPGAGKTSIFTPEEKSLAGILLPWPQTRKAWKAMREMGRRLGVFEGDNGVRFFEVDE